MNTQTTSAIKKAATLAGGVEQLAGACGVSIQAVYKWLKKGYPPTARCEDIELAVKGKVTRFDLLPPTFTKKPRRAQVTPP